MISHNHCNCKKTAALLTQQDFNGCFAHVVMTVKSFSHLIRQLLHHMTRVLVEQIYETLQHVEMESGRDYPAMRSPFVTLVK